MGEPSRDTQSESQQNDRGEVRNEREGEDPNLSNDSNQNDVLREMIAANINEESSSEQKSSWSNDICHESIPDSSESDKENTHKKLLESSIEYKQDETDSEIQNYERTDLIPLPDLLKLHPKTEISGFEFGEATKRRAQENMKSARNKTLEEKRKSIEFGDKCPQIGDTCVDVDQPSGSELDHKTPHSFKRQRLAESRALPAADADFARPTRTVPPCLLDSPNCIQIWSFMVNKEEVSFRLRNSRLFSDFKGVTPRMRTILLDWLMEVSAVYHLRRVTYYLSVDYFDRFLSIRPDIPKSMLQLIGITCLYIAAKVEEIYPPNLSEFSYVCDGACKAKDMVACELLILNSLGWEVVLTTASDWLNLYMQLHFKRSDVLKTGMSLDYNKDFIFPQYSAYQFTRASQLMDLMSLDPGFLRFSYSMVAATAMFFMFDQVVATDVSGLTWDEMKECAEYMGVFYQVIKDAPDPRLYSCLGEPHPDDAVRGPASGSRTKHGPQNENYSFQTHVASIEYFEKATVHRLQEMKEESANLNNNEVTKDASPIKECTKTEETNVNTELSKSDNTSSEQTGLISLDEIYEIMLSQDDNPKAK